MFKRHRVPLCLAVVPAWITARRWQYLKDLGAGEPTLWCWHQHGWRHVNHETDGKKQEFGASRSPSDIKRDLVLGKRRLEDILGQAFYPVFTPPWNRCDISTLKLMRELGYVAVSRSCGSEPKAPGGLPDFCVNIDLHTRKEPDPASGWNNLLKELQRAISSGRAGIMIHHQRMNAAAFDLLDILLKIMVKHRQIQLIHFRDMAGNSIVG
jgi:peptidoglycan/xylan/chitin deacetylase (PgdA/CDA1 family)